MTAESSSDALCRLASRIVNGEVVFFIGSGFSIDSEGNDARRLIRRLLIRLSSMTDRLSANGVMEANEIFNDLTRTFSIDPPQTYLPFQFSEKAIGTLAERYYEINDWFCVAFGRFLELLDKTSILGDIDTRAEEIRIQGRNDGKAIDPVPLEPIHPALITMAKTDARMAGKALFLDAMGFRNPEVMGGRPTSFDPLQAEDSYTLKLLPRHHVLARLAREGFCTTTITANFDLLLEGAFRAAGFTFDGSQSFSPPTRYNTFTRIASPSEFFVRGKAERDATLVKMHGCAEKYRNIDCASPALGTYLRSMVFTYREIQNWRQDSWAADYLRTLLRTRTVVFSGYSVQDPVIHDTFRTVYEEMERQRANEPSVLHEAKDAPAFFLAPGAEDRREFHGMEVLHAATRATCATTQFGQHPNYLRFRFRDRPEFPRLDEQFEWLGHAVFRLRQKDCLKAYLRRMVIGLISEARPDAELAAVEAAFDALWEQECETARSWSDAGASRREHAGICGWTSLFQAGLLREFASIEMVHDRRGPSKELALMRQLSWYYPTTAAGGWTCWGAVVELALRKMVAKLWSASSATPLPAHALRAGECLAPTILFAQSPNAHTPVALTIRFRAFERPGIHPRLLGFPSKAITWELGKNDAPWPTVNVKTTEDDPDATRFRPPSAADIWSWAATDRGTADEAQRLLGVTL